MRDPSPSRFCWSHPSSKKPDDSDAGAKMICFSLSHDGTDWGELISGADVSMELIACLLAMQIRGHGSEIGDTGVSESRTI
jgi:hypothetical protein